MKFNLIKELTKALYEGTGSFWWSAFFFLLFTGALIYSIYLLYLKYWKK
jgi:hypothetical protein